ncbi:MAG: ABC tungstate transporter substrate-binding protein [Candidatus Bathyarchaeota archaeon B26-2]|nr:MAG: ABC tungstate transporter substrate-binding protein [Candidatus Bathyarchaeota archaeon B26-2]
MVSDLLEGLRRAVELIISGDLSVLDATLRSLYVSGMATLLAALLGLPLGMIMGSREFPGKSWLRGLFNALLGIPTVGLGLILYLILSRSGPLGALGLLYTPSAIIIGQALLVLPILVSFTANAVEGVERGIKDLSKTLGASEMQASLTVFKEALPGVFLAVIAGFNRALAELGVALMLGGNIAGLTRVLTTTIALETTRGNTELGIALTLILLSIVFVLNSAANLIKERLWS